MIRPRLWRVLLDSRPAARPEDAVPLGTRADASKCLAEQITVRGAPHHCAVCDVKWCGGPVCWCCGRVVIEQ